MTLKKKKTKTKCPVSWFWMLNLKFGKFSANKVNKDKNERFESFLVLVSVDFLGMWTHFLIPKKIKITQGPLGKPQGPRVVCAPAQFQCKNKQVLTNVAAENNPHLNITSPFFHGLACLVCTARRL